MISMVNIFKKIKLLVRRKKIEKQEKAPVRVISPLDTVIEEYLKKTSEQGIKNIIVLRYVKKDSDVLFKVTEIKNSSVKANDSFYTVNARAVQFMRAELYDKERKEFKTIKIPVIDILEGRSEALSHERWCNDIGLSEEYQKQIYLQLLAGITEARRMKSATIRQWVIWGLIGIVAVVIIGGSIFK